MNHPFAVRAHFRQSTVLTFALPAEELQPQLPPPFTVDRWQDNTGFLAVALVDTHALRPAAFPAWLGQRFYLVGYRIFVRFTDARGRRLRGLYILRSQTNRRKMKLLGGLFTRYNYGMADLREQATPNGYRITAQDVGLDVTVDVTKQSLPTDSCFPDWKAARRFAGPLPFTFSYLPERKKVLWVEGVRSNWTPEPVAVTDCRIDALADLGFPHARLAAAFRVADVPYRWKAGHLENWPA